MIEIAIPSRARPSRMWEGPLANQLSKQKINLFVREEEVSAYRDKIPEYRKHITNIISVPNDFHLCEKRQRIVETCNSSHLIMIDDDVVFAKKKENDITKLQECTPEDISVMLALFEKVCTEERPMVHAVQRVFSNYRKYKYEKNVRGIRAVTWNVEAFKKLGIDYRYMYRKYGSEYKEDLDVQLQLISKGIPSIGVASFTVADRGYNRSGGVSLFRTADTFNKSAISLKKEYPDFVTLVEKSTGGYKEKRLDCKIAWKKFLPPGAKKYIPKEEIDEV